MTAWKLRDRRHSTADPKVSSDVEVLVAPEPDGAFAFAGVLLLDEAESNDLADRLKKPFTVEEFSTVWQALVGTTDAEERRAAARIMERFKPRDPDGGVIKVERGALTLDDLARHQAEHNEPKEPS